MKKRGFTLAELMGVIVILGVIGLITIPTIDKSLRDGRENLYQTQIENLKHSLATWAGANAFQLPDEGGEITITLAQLKQAGAVELDIKNPKTKTMFPNDMLFTVRNNNGILEYIVHEDSGTEGNTDTYDSSAPSIVLNGSAYEIVEVKEPYIEKGVIAKTATGEGIPESRIETVVSGNGTIDTNTLNQQYTVTYRVSDQGRTTTVKRTVVVKDTTPPLLTVPANTTVSVSDIPAFRLLDGVGAIDNSGVTPTITTSGNLSAIPMRYVIRYTATDASGNTGEAYRVITVIE